MLPALPAMRMVGKAMGNQRRKKLKRANYYNTRLRDVIIANGPTCRNCGKKTGGCFMPPSFGEEGFYVCKPADGKGEAT